eukprot:gene3993-4623_t
MTAFLCGKPLKHGEFENIYRRGYNLVLHKQGDALYNALRQCLDTNVDTVQLPSLLECCTDDPPLSFVQEVLDQWRTYKCASVMIRDCLMYLERTYVEQGNLDGVFELATKIYQSKLLANATIKKYLCHSISTIIDSSRVDTSSESMPLLSAFHSFLIDCNSTHIYGDDFYRQLCHSVTESLKVSNACFLPSTDPDLFWVL